MSLLIFLVFGFFVGLIARAIMPGTQKMGIVRTTLIGAAGSFIGGLIGNLISGDALRLHSAGWIGSVIGAIVLMVVLGRRG
ncbi:MAG TPA: GlsB/YeaQ/YmgE family stress response membrane protein [Polyangiaceae bacterium]|nr:GlsB/YeaQ/YmgE family stress response membrane protein [Polyangiaceae bacterium]